VTPALLTLARRALTGEARIERGSPLVAAVSGGPDSMVLLHVLARLAPKVGIVLHAHGVDHGLRDEAARELDSAAAFAESLGVSFGRTNLRVPRGGNLQARARAARYAALAEAARAVGASAIATAHHADDRAETVLLRLLRGAGPRGLAALPPRAPLGDTGIELLRPLLRARRSSILAHLERHAVPFSTDPSNQDPRYLRTRVRHELLPLLEQLSPRIVDHLLALADQLTAEAGETPTSFPLPRSTQVALAELMRSRSRTARVWLPGGLVVTVDPQAHTAARPRARARLREAPD
jgi:tRNA(Ile)-lysidine synthase